MGGTGATEAPVAPDLPAGTPAGAPGPRPGDDARAAAAWSGVTGSAPATAHRTAHAHAAQQSAARAAAALHRAEDELAPHDTVRGDRERVRAAALVRDGMDPAEAQVKAASVIRDQAEQLQKRVAGLRSVHLDAVGDAAAAETGTTEWDQAADAWARSTESIADAVEALGIADDRAARTAFETYAGLVRTTPTGTPPVG